MPVTGHEFAQFARGSTGNVGAGAQANLATVPAGERWEIHNFDLLVTDDATTSTFTIEVSDTTGANFFRSFTGTSVNGVLQVNLTSRPTDTTEASFLLRKLLPGQIIRVDNIGTGTISDFDFDITGIKETFA